MYLPMSVNAACSGASCCVVASGGVTTAPAGDSCETEPESYGITLYEKYDCCAIPFENKLSNFCINRMVK